MADSYGQQISNLVSQYQAAADPKAQSTIRQTINEAVGNFKPEFQEIANLEAKIPTAFGAALDAQPGFYGQAGYNPSALTRLGEAIGSGGRAAAQANMASNLLNQRRGRLENIVQDVYGQYGTALDSIGNQVSMLSPLYQGEMAQREAEAARQFQAQQAELDRQLSRENSMRSGGGSSSSMPNLESIMAALGLLDGGEPIEDINDWTIESVNTEPVRQSTMSGGQSAWNGSVPQTPSGQQSLMPVNPTSSSARQSLVPIERQY